MSPGYAYHVLKIVNDMVLAEGGSLDDILSLVDDPDKCRRVALEIVGRKPALQTGSPYRGGLPADHYTAEVTEAIPAFAELKRRFPGFCSELWDATRYDLKTDRSCLDVEETGAKVFWLRNYGKPMTADNVIVSAEREGYRPATLREALAFVAANQDTQLTGWTVVLGSFALRGVGYHIVPCLGADGGGSWLRDAFFDGYWDANRLFLLVRK